MLVIKELTDLELESALQALTEWTISVSDIPGREPSKSTELYRQFEFASFEDALAFMGGAVQRLSKLEYHPRWENIWRTVSVWLTTWDIGQKTFGARSGAGEVLRRAAEHVSSRQSQKVLTSVLATRQPALRMSASGTSQTYRSTYPMSGIGPEEANKGHVLIEF
jgi:pterin-4a-carbinolamine dehydratase